MSQHLRPGLVPEVPHSDNTADGGIWGILFPGVGVLGRSICR